MKKVVITHAKRTPVGAFNGSLSSLSATQLGSIAIKDVLVNIRGNILVFHEGQGIEYELMKD